MLKKITCILLSVFILSAFILQSNIYIVLASDNDFTLSVSYDKARNGFALSSSESSNAVNNKGDIYTSDHLLMFMYTPADSYNWTTYAKNTVLTLHLSDSQLKAILMSSNPFENLFYMIKSLSNTETIRAIAKGLGIAFNGKSSVGTELLDTITGNYNYLNGINYDIESQTLTIDNSSVDKLREEIKKYYYIENGMFYYKPYGSFSNVVSTSSYSDMTLYQEDYNLLQNYDYAFKTGNYILAFNKSDFNSFYFTGSYNSFDSGGSNCLIQFVDNNFNAIDLNFNSNFNYVSDAYSAYSYHSVGFHSGGYNSHYWIKDSLTHSASWGGSDSFVYYFNTDNSNHGWDYGAFYSKDNSDLLGFVSYEALYNYFHGDKNAYLSSRIDKAGEDISFSIKDMNENLGNKMDALIDSINSGKGNMSADELQNAIDKGLADLNKNTEDIKDNTEEMNSKLDSVLEALNAQNETLLAILGVTKKIADSVDDIDENANFSSLMSLLSTVFLGIQNAILYGQNTMDNNNNTDAQAVMYDEDEIAVYSSGGGTSLDYRGGIFGHFPFSVIYHLYDWLKVLQTEPKCPEFSYNYGFMIGRKDDTECQITFDLSQYESWRDVISSFMKLSFTLAVAVGTYKKFKGGDLS